MGRMRWGLVVVVVAAACGSDGDGTPGGASGGGGAGAAGGAGGASACVPNQQLACACGGDVVGYQTCLADGSGFNPCVCPDSGAGGGGVGADAASGGGGGADAASGGGGSGGTTDCISGLKLCGNVCVAQNPSVGCGAPGCDACPAPPKAQATCNGLACDFVCDWGYVKSGSGCVVGTSGGGGSGASGGSGGTGASGGLGGTGGSGASGGLGGTGGLGGIGGLGGTGASGGSGGTSAICNPASCPTPAAPAVKCCVTANGPCGIDFQQGAGCQIASTTDGGAGFGGFGGFGGIDGGANCPATKPTSGSACSAAALCQYGSSFCFCASSPLMWSCN